MARSRLSLRREAEAAELARPAKKKAAGKKTTRKKAAGSRVRRARDVAPRRRLVWVVYSSTMREEGRYLYHERDKADQKLEQLMAKGKRRYFIQPIKEPLDSEGVPLTEDVSAPVAAKPADSKTGKRLADSTEDDDNEDEVESDDEADSEE